jgi:hypothetical protein
MPIVTQKEALVIFDLEGVNMVESSALAIKCWSLYCHILSLG